jgi:hypothetical protein
VTVAVGVTNPTTVGRVPSRWEDGQPLQLTRTAQGSIVLTWGASCMAADEDYAVYEGPLGSFTEHSPALCSTAGARQVTLNPGGGSSYYIVVPRNGVYEGAHGTNSAGTPRDSGPAQCLPTAPEAGCP